MCSNLPRMHEGWGRLNFHSKYVIHALLAIAVLTPVPSFAQSQPTPSSALPVPKGKSAFTYVDELASVSRAGNSDATTELVHQMLLHNGIPSDMADAFGFTNRVVRAEAAFRGGGQAPIREANIVTAINSLANTVGAPVWVQTNQAEVRMMRMRLLATYPHLIASQEPPDANGHYKAINESMRPVESVWIALSLLYQKRYNADFQFTDEEKAQNIKLDSATVKAKHLERTETLRSLVRGQSGQSSIRDLLTAFNHFLDDLGIQQAVKPATSGITAMPKGGR